ncbi:MAG: D-cysteine desulfhydrase family protein [Alphaproteobacteria bacterium]|nr:D-cysteine desulfhydrase family protein [Alphaproteobacteria bacterium]
MNLTQFPRIRLGHLPTPLERMDRLRAALGDGCPILLVKRDDCTGLATGGNKTRKLEFLMGEAQERGAGAVVTFGALQSNHARQTAAAAAKLGLPCDLILIGMVPRDCDAYRSSGNVLYDRLLGARIHFAKDEKESTAAFQRVAAAHSEAGRGVYVVPIGGSNAVGSLGYVDAFDEIAAQAEALGLAVDAIVHGSSSGGTQAGLVAGATLADSATRIMGVNVYKKHGADIGGAVHTLALETLHLLGVSLLDVSSRVQVIDGYQGSAYGIPTDAMREAVELTARTEGLLLDPVYAGKAMAALIGEVRKGAWRQEQTVVFLHTGGTAALSAYVDAFT